jgi:peptide methionine sulfoxide reductase MsrA
MSYPLLVEAIENEFVPLLIHNNKGGEDAKILKKFNEPSWNNPVVRFLDSSGQDVTPRKDRIWTTVGIADRMLKTLKTSKRAVPFYFDAFVRSTTKAPATATFAMHCYWEGEAKLGSIDGVLSTRSGWQSGLEVVTVHYDPSIVDYRKLVTTAQKFSCASKVFAHNEKQLKIAAEIAGDRAVKLRKDQPTRDAKASDQKYYLAHTPLKHLPLTEVQATKLNAAVKAKSRDYGKYLSPRQRELLAQVIARQKSSPDALTGYVFPRDPGKLAKFETQLRERLQQVSEAK